ncbi:FAS1-like dehydratase domain-containing protein [Actinomyces slackii]|uniref:FAS1-like dehydratase domain-containing protein n=1 Tax=Actinomyces slackii TaxID=52774 RepID=UPI0009FCA887|nr:MaoC family dehydratase N-terminal domain-containing protein [Actinomyces slackii]
MKVFNRDFLGRTHGPDGPYEVSREKIRDYAIATGETNPIYYDAAAAQHLGYEDVIAPPSFMVCLFFRYGGWPLYDPEFGKKKQPVCVHRAQKVKIYRQIIPGDELWQTTTITDIREVSIHDEFTMRHEITDNDGRPVAEVTNTILSRNIEI